MKIAWLEQQTGVADATLRRHYGKWMPTEAGSELRRFAALDPRPFRRRTPLVCPRGQGGSGTTAEKEQ